MRPHDARQGGKARSGRFPTLLMRTPYNKEVRAGPVFYKEVRAAPLARYFATRGYVVVVQDVRGRYKSQGQWDPLRSDPADGFDTARWIGEQAWCDGSIGAMGSSYDGATAHALAIAGAPYLNRCPRRINRSSNSIHVA